MKPPSKHALIERAIVVQYLRQIAQKSRRLARKVLNQEDASAFDLHTAALAAHMASDLSQAAMDLEQGRHREGAPHVLRGAESAKKKPCSSG